MSESKPMKPTKAWAVVLGGYVPYWANDCDGRGEEQMLIFYSKALAKRATRPGERIVRVEIRELPPQGRRGR